MLPFLRKPKQMMIFGVICMLVGLGVFALWKVDGLSHWDIAGTKIVHWFRRSLGRYGCSGLYFLGGLIVFLKGYAAMRSDERSRNVQNQQRF